MILDDKDPEGAMEYLLNRYEDPLKSACAIHSNIGKVRRHIALNEDNRNKNYVELVTAIAEKATNKNDQDDLANLLAAPLLKQHAVYMSKKPFLQDKELDKELHEVRPCKVVMYRFKTPNHIIEAYRSNRKERVKSQHNHQNKDAAAYNVSHEEIDSFVKTAREVMATPVRDGQQYHECSAALGLVTGRRNFEILKTATIAPVEGFSYQAKVSGIAKRKFMDDPVFTIPLLCPYKEVEHALQSLRNYRQIDGNCEQAGKHYEGITRATRRLFKRSLDHTEKRSIYIEHAYVNRENNGFMANGCSKKMWNKMALCHDELEDQLPYQAMNIE